MNLYQMIRHIYDDVKQIRLENKQMAEDIAGLNDELTQVESAQTTLATDAQTLIADFEALQAQQAAGNPITLDEPIARLKALLGKMGGVDASINAADAPASSTAPAGTASGDGSANNGVPGNGSTAPVGSTPVPVDGTGSTPAA